MTLSGTVEIRLKPNARQQRLTAGESGVLDAWVNAPPVEGKANAALIALLAECLGIPKSRVSIKRGLASRRKVVSVAGMTKEEMIRAIAVRG